MKLGGKVSHALQPVDGAFELGEKEETATDLFLTLNLPLSSVGKQGLIIFQVRGFSLKI